MKRSSVKTFFLITIFGVLASSLSLYFMLIREKEKEQRNLYKKSEEIKDSINRELYKTESILKGIKGFINSSQEVTRKEFQIFCRNLVDKDFPLHIIEWQPKVSAKEREPYEQRARQDGLKNFYFFEIDKEGKEVVAKNRDFHFPVYYSYSPEDVPKALGLDLAFSSERMDSKFLSMKLGKPVSSGIFDVIVKGTSKRSPGFAVTYPVFDDPTISSSESIKHLKGFIATVLYVNEFFRPLEKLPSMKSFYFEVRDRNDDNKIIYKSKNDESRLKDLVITNNVSLNNREWTLFVYPTASFFKNETLYLPWATWFLMVLISFGLGYYLYLKSLNQQKINDYERQIQQKQKLESIGILASGIAHEFNNILHCITLASENLSMSQREDVRRESSETLIEYCKRGRFLIQQILSFARQDTGQYRDVLPSQEIKKTIDLMVSSFNRKIKFDLDIEELDDELVSMNVNHLSQILINLCTNAAHAMGEEGVIYITYGIEGGSRVITVTDSGHGMDDDVINKIFDPFFTTKPVNEGTGLGLSVIYGIVKSYNGEIEVESKVGKGTTFKVILPF